MGIIVKKEIAEYFARNTPSTHSLLWCPQCGNMITPALPLSDRRYCDLCHKATLTNLSKKETND